MAQQEVLNEQRIKEEKDKERGDKKVETPVIKKKDGDPLYSDDMKHALKIMERHVNSNFYDENYADYK